MSTITECRACNSRRLKKVLDLGEQPFANALLEEEQLEGEKKYPLSLYYCEDCHLAQLSYTADPKELFSNYFWVTATSSTARSYAARFCEEALKRAADLGKRGGDGEENGGGEENLTGRRGYVLEAASNDGTFLKEFKKRGLEVLGVDPAANIARQADAEGIPTRTAFFGRAEAADIVALKGYPSIVYARNVLPHVADLHDFVDGLKRCCTPHNLLILEVHYAGKIIEEVHYDSIYHEHLCYFTLKSVANLLKQHGLYPFDVMPSPISGGSIVLYVRDHEEPLTDAYRALLKEEEEKEYNELSTWQGFADRAARHRIKLRSAVEKELEGKRKLVAYGASARSSTMLNYCGIGHSQVKEVIDQNPLKQGKYTPGSHMHICCAGEGLKEHPDTVLLLAWNFKEEILALLRDQYGFHGRVIVPLPDPVKTEMI